MPDLVFTIKTPAELQGAEAAAEQLEIAIGKAKALGKEYDAQEERLSAIKQSIQAYTASQAEQVRQTQNLSAGQVDLGKTTAELTANVGKADAATRAYNVTKKNLQDIAKGLQGIMPILGNAFRLLSNPLAATVAVMGTAIAMFVEMRRRAAELAKDVEFTPAAESVRNLARAEQEAADASDDFFRKLGAVRDVLKELQEHSDLVVQSIQNQAAAANTAAEAAEALAKANLEALHAAGRITDQEFAARSGHLELSASQGQTSRARALRAALAGAGRQEVTRTTGARDAAEESLTPARRAQLQAEVALNDAKAQLADAKAETEALDKKAAAGGLRPDEQQRRGGLRGLAGRLEATLPDLENNVTRTTEATKKIEQTILDLNTSLDGLKRKIAAMESQTAVTDAAGQGAQNTRVTAAGSRTAASALSLAQGAASRVAAGGIATPQEQELIRTVGSNIAGENVNVATAIKMLQMSANNSNLTNSFLERLVAQTERNDRLLRILESRLNTLANGP